MSDNDKSDAASNPLISLLGGGSEPPAPATESKGSLTDSIADLISATDGMDLDQILDPKVRDEQIELQAAATNLVEFASMDVTQISAIKSHADRIANAADKYILRDAESFRSVADALDAAMQSDERFTAFGLGSVRNYVMSLMTSMNRNEEFASILLDRDIRNCILFARKTYEMMNEEDAVLNRAKADKAAARAAKPATPKAQRATKAAKLVAGIDISKLF